MIKLYDRIKQTTYSIGTGDIALSGAIAGFSTFSSVYQNNDFLFYCITDGINYEIGSGTYVSSSNTIKRYSIKSTNSNQLVNFGYGLKEIYVNYPATNSVINPYGISSTPQNSGIAFWTSSNLISYSDKFNIDSGNGRIGINKTNPTATIDIGGSSATSSIKASGFFVGNSGVYFPSGNNGLSSYSGGIQLTHFEMNKLDSNLSSILQLSGVVNQNILVKKQNAGTVFAGPPSGCSPPCDPAYPSFRPLTLEDIPDLSSVYGNYNAVLSGIFRSDITAVSGMCVNSSGILNGKINSASGSLNSKIDSISGIVYTSSGALNSRITAVSGYLDNKINSSINPNNILSQFRISTSTTDPLAEGVSQAIYLHPYLGNIISLFNGSAWEAKTFSSILALNAATVTANINYDIFVYLNGSALAFESVVWSNDTSRSVEISLQDGVYCKVNNKTRRYIGSVRKISSSFHNDYSLRLVFNAYNRVRRLSMTSTSDHGWSLTRSYEYTVVNTGLVPTIRFLHGLPEMIDANINLLVELPGVRAGYQLILLDQFYSEYTISNNNVFDDVGPIIYASNSKINAIGQGFYLDGDYQDLIKTVATASMTTELTGYLQLLAVERVPIGVSPIISTNAYIGAVGYNATSYQ